MVLVRPASAQSPTGGAVVAGTAGISQAGAVTNINQSSQKAVINWQGFSVGAQNTVNFNQPNSSAATLNRVIGNERSVIDGAINANGQVFIVNSAGVLFGKGAQVNVGGLVASTLDISNNDFMAGELQVLRHLERVRRQPGPHPRARRGLCRAARQDGVERGRDRGEARHGGDGVGREEHAEFRRRLAG
jgi:filamentous hemagglutinin family protein